MYTCVSGAINSDKKSNIGEFNIEVLNNEVNFLFQAMLGIVNDNLLKPIAIPSVGGNMVFQKIQTYTEGVTLENEHLKWNTGVLSLTSDLVLKKIPSVTSKTGK